MYCGAISHQKQPKNIHTCTLNKNIRTWTLDVNKYLKKNETQLITVVGNTTYCLCR